MSSRTQEFVLNRCSQIDQTVVILEGAYAAIAHNLADNVDLLQYLDEHLRQIFQGSSSRAPQPLGSTGSSGSTRGRQRNNIASSTRPQSRPGVVRLPDSWPHSDAINLIDEVAFRIKTVKAIPRCIKRTVRADSYPVPSCH